MMRSARHLAPSRRLLKRLTRGVLALVVAGLFATTARAADVSLMIGGIEKQIYLPAVLAQQLGYFKDEGIDVGSGRGLRIQDRHTDMRPGDEVGATGRFGESELEIERGGRDTVVEQRHGDRLVCHSIRKVQGAGHGSVISSGNGGLIGGEVIDGDVASTALHALNDDLRRAIGFADDD